MYFFHRIVCQWFHQVNRSFSWQNYLYDCQAIVLNGESYCGLSDEGKKVWQPCRQMRQIYLRLFQRKLLSAGCSYMDISQFHKILQKVKIFARFMESFTNWLSYGCQATPPFWKRLSDFDWKMLRRAFPQTYNLGRIWWCWLDQTIVNNESNTDNEEVLNCKGLLTLAKRQW
jgi:hypothetical protein